MRTKRKPKKDMTIVNAPAPSFTTDRQALETALKLAYAARDELRNEYYEEKLKLQENKPHKDEDSYLERLGTYYAELNILKSDYYQQKDRVFDLIRECKNRLDDSEPPTEALPGIMGTFDDELALI